VLRHHQQRSNEENRKRFEAVSLCTVIPRRGAPKHTVHFRLVCHTLVNQPPRRIGQRDHSRGNRCPRDGPDRLPADQAPHHLVAHGAVVKANALSDQYAAAVAGSAAPIASGRCTCVSSLRHFFAAIAAAFTQQPLADHGAQPALNQIRWQSHLHHPPPAIPPKPTIVVTGPIDPPLTVGLTDLEELEQVERVENFHCVAGWSAIGLRWEAVPFVDFYRTLLEPRLTPGPEITHVVFRGYDGYGSIVRLDDALADDVLIATRLDGKPLSPAHGAPVRLVSPSQYGYVSTKHLCAIELHTTKPRDDHPYSVVTRSHPRARVWNEERHAWFPGAVLRWPYRALIRPIAWLSRREHHERDIATRPLPARAHTERPWLVHDLAPDFRLEDVWALPTPGGPDDFPRLVAEFIEDEAADAPLLVRLLFAIRWRHGAVQGLDLAEADVGNRVASLRERIPEDLAEAPGLRSVPGRSDSPFHPVYLTGNEYVAEIANRTCHALMHLGWVEDEGGGYRGQMAVLNKPNGPMGHAYMALIKPFRHGIVYPALMRTIAKRWADRGEGVSAARRCVSNLRSNVGVRACRAGSVGAVL
jgi:hypothetical protein